jgi:hypothetical protein
MSESDDFFRAAIVAGRTVKRLELAGFGSDEARRLVLTVIQAEERVAVADGYVFDAARFIQRLEGLPSDA